MPMPPPKATTARRTGSRGREQVRQILRALRSEGDLTRDDLHRLVGAPYWKPGHFDRALQTAVAEGLVTTADDGRMSATTES
jgi:hypothetical protein